MYPDRAYLALSHPNAGQLRNPPCLDPKIRQRVDHGLFDGAHISAHIALPFAQIHDRISDDLPRPVIGHVPAAIRRVKSNARPAQDLVARQQILQVPVAAQRNGMRMLQQHKLIGNRARFALGDKLLLPCEGCPVLYPARLAQLALMH